MRMKALFHTDPTKPHVAFRFLLLLLAVCSAYIESNPLVRLQAMLGLSPSPLERFFGVKSLFSGMTEGVHQFARGRVLQSIEANAISPFVLPLSAYFLVTWRCPKLDTRFREGVFFLACIVLSIVVNFLN